MALALNAAEDGGKTHALLQKHKTDTPARRLGTHSEADVKYTVVRAAGELLESIVAAAKIIYGVRGLVVPGADGPGFGAR